jgi:hypothetical protein
MSEKKTIKVIKAPDGQAQAAEAEQTRVVERPQPDDPAIPSRILPGQDCDTCSEQAVPSLRDFDLDVFFPDEGAAQNIDIS